MAQIYPPGIFHRMRKFHASPLLSLPDYFWPKFRTPSAAKFLNILFSSLITCCYLSVSSCCFFLQLLLTINRKEDIFNVKFLFDSESYLCIPNTSGKFVGLLKKTRSNIIQMLEKYLKSRLTKNEDNKAALHFEENNYQGDDLHANCNKTD